MDLNGNAGLAKANPALPKEFHREENRLSDFLPYEFFSTAVAAKKCNNLITSLIE
ncbi:MAG: hypothetical protein R2825_11485 [Saprospiraceae bacterium]